MKPRYSPRFTMATGGLALALFLLPTGSWAQQDQADDADDQPADTSIVWNEVTLGLYYLSDESYRYGKYSGLTDDGFEPVLDFSMQKRPDWESSDTVRWRLQGWRLGLDSRRLEFAYNDQGTRKFHVDYRELPNYR